MFRLEVASEQLPGKLDQFGFGILLARCVLTRPAMSPGARGLLGFAALVSVVVSCTILLRIFFAHQVY